VVFWGIGSSHLFAISIGLLHFLDESEHTKTQNASRFIDTFERSLKCHSMFSVLVNLSVLMFCFISKLSSSLVLRQTHTRTYFIRASRDELPDIRGKPIQIKVRDVDAETRTVNLLDTGTPEAGFDKPPLVLLAGTAQTIGTYAGHIRQIGSTRRLIIPELRCQGRTDLLPQYGTIEQLARDVVDILEILGIKEQKIDLCGFSFGGRVALAVAAYHGQVVNSLSVTGVPLQRGSMGSLILQSWAEGLRQSPPEMRSVAWSFILNGYSTAFTERYAKKIPSIVDMIVEANDPSKLGALLTHSHIPDSTHPYSVASCASILSCRTQVIGASADKIASIDTVRALAAAIQSSTFVEIPGCGHLVPFENPGLWRKNLLMFLDNISTSEDS